MSRRCKCRIPCKIILITSLVWILLDLTILHQVKKSPTSQLAKSLFPPPVQWNVQSKNLPNEDETGDVDYNSKLTEEDIKNMQIADAKNRAASARSAKEWSGINTRSSDPGEGGKPVRFTTDSDLKKSKEMFKINQFNLLASNVISLDRSLKYVRNPSCKARQYDINKLPTTSVVIVFHNEAWSTLLRTVHSVINRSPWQLVKEIILVDDASERDHLKTQLETEVYDYPIPVKIVRQKERKGLIRARLAGAEIASADTITFLDAHCECTKGWLEPLLYRIARNRKTVICPIIDVISDDTFEYLLGSEMTYGGFNWKLNFRWYPVPAREDKRRGYDKSQPLQSPTMAGGLFTIDRDYFYEIGSYDEGMDIWGGENLEMSFRIWQCGGILEIHPCSHVGHVFRKQTPYSFPGGTGAIINKNNRRLAEVWMDDFKKFYYIINPGVLKAEYGDVSERKQLREKLECKSFQWYLDNIYPESQIPKGYLSLGEIKSDVNHYCLDTLGSKENGEIGAYYCHGQGGNQIWSLTDKGEIRNDDLCLDSANKGPIKMIKCHGQEGNQYWHFTSDRHLQHGHNRNLCLEITLSNMKKREYKPILVPCENGKPEQVFSLTNATIPGMEPVRNRGL